jgi:hypothetical protein
MASNYDYSEFLNTAEESNKVGVFQSMLAGVGSGLIAIPKGLFSLGASLMDLGVNSGKAAEVERWFDDLTEWDEKAEATAAGKLTELLVNIGIPGGFGFKLGSGLAKQAMLAKKGGKYLKLDNPALKKGVQQAVQLNARGKTNQFIAGALAGGVGEGVFVGDVEKIGSFGDLLGGPTEIDRGDDPDAAREILNRVKFGTEGALFTGVIGGVGKTIGKLTNRNKQLDINNDKLDGWIDKVASWFRSRSAKTPEFFELETGQIGRRGADALRAKNVSRDLDTNIDSIFPAWRTMGNSVGAKERKKLLAQVNDLLLTGNPSYDDMGKVVFPTLDQTKKMALVKRLKELKMDDEVITDLFGNLSSIRGKWAELFEALGGTLRGEDLASFKKLFGKKFTDYLGSTYDVFINDSILPWLRYKPTAQAVENAKKMFMKSADEAGKPITDLQAERYVQNILDTAALPKGFRMDRASDAIFKVPDFFINRTTLDDAAKEAFKGRIVGSQLVPADRKIIDELLGKTKNPMQTILAGTSKLSLITRRNEFFDDLIKKSNQLKADKKLPMFADSEEEALMLFGRQKVKRIDIDLGKKLQVGEYNPLNGKYAPEGIADALAKTSTSIKDLGMAERMYYSFALYPKAASQIAKTILSPITHLRNFISAGAFSAANGIIPLSDPAAVKQAYQALQTGLKGTRMQNDLYEKLLELQVVNSNVRLGDLTRLMEDVGFGASMTGEKGMRMLLKPLQKIKNVGQDLYTAEDDFWKIYSWAIEKSRLAKAFEKHGMTRGKWFKDSAGNNVRLTEEWLEKEAADIVKNNIPNYSYVSDFVKGLRKWPIGNFVSFPAEIARTGTNIVRRGLREINETITLADGTVVKPFQTIGYTRLFGFGVTTAAVPMATVAGFQALYDVTDDEREAIRRYVADWSKNSTILPIKDKETGEFSYVDFSHANAYDTLTRPIQSVINAVADGREDEDGIMDDFLLGMMTGMKEFALPFVSESIWTEAVIDLIGRGGRTRDGFQVYSEADNPGDKANKMFKHLVKAVMPFSAPQLIRLDKSLRPVDVLEKGKFDKYGQTYEFGPEFAGLFGFRGVKINPDRTMKFKVADYQKGVRESGALFTRNTLRGGPISPAEIVDAYINANRSLFAVKKNLKADMDAARLLNISEDAFNSALDRLSNVEVNSIDENIFRPYEISNNVADAFQENADKLGLPNPLDKALDVIDEIRNQLEELPLSLGKFPDFPNPIADVTETGEEVAPPLSLNLPNVEAQTLAAAGQGNQYSSLTTQQKLDLLFPRG